MVGESDFSPPLFKFCSMYDVDLYTYNGTIIHNECSNIEDVFTIIRDMISDVQLINIKMS